MFRQTLKLTFAALILIANTGSANEMAEFNASIGDIEEIGNLMQYVVVDGTQCQMNAATLIVDEKGAKRTRGALKQGQQIQVFFDTKQKSLSPVLTKIVILGGK